MSKNPYRISVKFRIYPKLGKNLFQLKIVPYRTRRALEVSDSSISNTSSGAEVAGRDSRQAEEFVASQSGQVRSEALELSE